MPRWRGRSEDEVCVATVLVNRVENLITHTYSLRVKFGKNWITCLNLISTRRHHVWWSTYQATFCVDTHQRHLVHTSAVHDRTPTKSALLHTAHKAQPVLPNPSHSHSCRISTHNPTPATCIFHTTAPASTHRRTYEQLIKRELKGIHISGCRCNERLKAKSFECVMGECVI